MSLPGIKAVLLDVDGTLIDSNDQQARSWVEAFKESGRAMAYEDVRSRIGKGGDKMVAELFGLESDEPQAKALAGRASAIFLDRYLHDVKPTLGARELLARLKASDLRLVVATSADDKMLSALLQQAGVEDLIDKASTSADVDSSKPDPDLVHQALARAHVAGSEAVMLGDTPYDIEAAKAAGVRTVALRCGGWWDDAALAGAVAIFDHPAEILARWGHLLARPVDR